MAAAESHRRERVAVVIPCYNDGATLSETLESLREQEDHELVVVDDGSTDADTLELLDDLDRTGTRVVHRPNGGLAAARMTGLEATDAPYVFPVDADDVLGEKAIARLANALDSDPSVQVAWGDVVLFGTLELEPRMPGTLDPWLLTFFNPLPGTCMFRRSAVTSVGGWRLTGGYEDWDLWLTFAEHGYRGTYVRGTMLKYRQHEGRMNEMAIGQHRTKYAEVRALHADLFASRRHLRKASPEPWHTKMLISAVASLPVLPLWTRLQLSRLIHDPANQLASWRRHAGRHRPPT